MSLQLLVILVPVLFGLMGFALDLGRLYLVRGELTQAAGTMALAAATQLTGTSASLDNAATAANQSIDVNNTLANKYFFASLSIGQSTGDLNSTVASPAFYATVSDATSGTANQADGTTARHVQITLTADAPLLFWSLLSVGQSRKTTVAAQAVAGISAPVCTACGIEPFAIAPIDSTDTDNFGFGDPTAGTLYTFAYSCLGGPTPTTLTGTSAVISYILIDRYDSSNATLDESQQLYRDGAAGLLASTSSNPTGSAVPIGCVGINDTAELLWSSAIPQQCSQTVTTAVTDALCGLYSRFDNASVPSACSTDVTNFDSLYTAFLPDTDVTTGQSSLYTEYTGNGRRVITVPIVGALVTDVTSTMTVLGFRQFLLELNSDGSYPSPTDSAGRFAAMYIGSPAPLKQGYVDDRFSLSCPVPVASGPGKVVLHQ